MSNYYAIETAIAILRRTGNGSAAVCAKTAADCLDKHEAGEAHPNAEGLGELPSSWLESAAAWCRRGAQHAFGFKVPAGWPMPA